MSKVNDFRKKLIGTLDVVATRRDEFSRGVAAVVQALLTDFNYLWPIEVWNRDSVKEAIGKYCEQNKSLCPICSSTLVDTFSSNTTGCLQCSNAPQCKGARHKTNYYPILNQDLTDYLTERVQKDIVKDKMASKKNLNRFAKI